MAIVDQEVKRRYPPDMKEKAFWLNEAEKCKSEVEMVSLLVRELVRIEHLVGITSVIQIINALFTFVLLFAVVWGSIQSGPIDMMQAKQGVGLLKSLLGGK
jgi:hypothetical protein